MIRSKRIKPTAHTFCMCKNPTIYDFHGAFENSFSLSFAFSYIFFILLQTTVLFLLILFESPPLSFSFM